jgi:hypothetical protein
MNVLSVSLGSKVWEPFLADLSDLKMLVSITLQSMLVHHYAETLSELQRHIFQQFWQVVFKEN